MNAYQQRNTWSGWLPIALLSLVLLPGCRLLGTSGSSHLKSAEELSRQKQFDGAILEYRRHMEERLKIRERPEWENPYFYLILIGDIQLGQNDPVAARKSYDDAETAGVDVALVSDRYRSLAAWYEKQNKLKESVEILKARRDKDPLIFDSILDRVLKALTAQEEAASSRPENGLSRGP